MSKKKAAKMTSDENERGAVEESFRAYIHCSFITLDGTIQGTL